MSGNNQRNDCNDGSDEQLPRPQLLLEEEAAERQRRADDATHGLRPEAQNDARDEAAHGDEKALERAVALREDTCDTHHNAAEAADDAHVDPHLQDDVRVERPSSGARVVLM